MVWGFCAAHCFCDDVVGLSAKDRLAAHAAGRAAADANLLVPGSPAWDQAYNKAITTGLSLAGGGAGILDQSKSNTFEVNYNLQDLVSIADIIIGGSHRTYILRSNGTLFTDYDAPIEYTDMGMYVQAKKDFIARQPMGRLGTAEEIAAVAVYLAGDDATFTTGTTISVDGGISI